MRTIECYLKRQLEYFLRQEFAYTHTKSHICICIIIQYLEIYSGSCQEKISINRTGSIDKRDIKIPNTQGQKRISTCH